MPLVMPRPQMPLSLRYTSVVSLFGLLFALNSCRQYLESDPLYSGVEPKLAAGKSFGEVLDNKLLSIMAGERGQFRSISIGKEEDRDESTLKNVFFDILAFKLYQ